MKRMRIRLLHFIRRMQRRNPSTQKVRKYENAREYSLFSSNIPVSVYDNLIDAVHEALPVFYRYVALRKRLLKVDELHMYDVYAPLVDQDEQKIDFEQAKQMVEGRTSTIGRGLY